METEALPMDAVAEQDSLQTDAPSNLEPNEAENKVDDEIRELVDEVQKKQTEKTNENQKQIEKGPEVMETSTEAPQNSGDGVLSAAMPKYLEDNPSPGRSNTAIKKKRRKFTIVTFDNPRQLLPRKSKTIAYEYLKNIAKGVFNSGPGTALRRRVKRKKMATRTTAKGRHSKNVITRDKRGKKLPVTVAKNYRPSVRDSGTSLSSGNTDNTDSNTSSRYGRGEFYN